MSSPYPAPASADEAFPAPSPDARRAWNWLPLQVFATGLITFVVAATWISVSDQYSEGMQVVGLALGSAVITIAAFLLGLPLRVAPLLRAWWVRHGGWPVIVALLGIAGLVLSYVVGDAGPLHVPADDLFPEVNGYLPDGRIFVPSYGLLALATMHTLPPRRRSLENG
ncbi:hypothetical protein [Microbacterium sp. NPDC089695]|uniref:hypothetical protein n=1 Tax=Microbacterium sp. NPDC089695 TaxID=3364198 RepID=UPI0038085CFA